MNILWTVLYLLAAVAITLGLAAVGRKYVFTKIRINKWIVLGIAVILFIAQVFLGNKTMLNQFLFMIPTLWFFLWFMELQTGVAIKEKEKKIVIRPKAKPNRAKHLNKDKK